MQNDIQSLPIYSHLDRILSRLAENSTLLLSAEPGAGKTTLVPWKMLSSSFLPEQKILMLSPRRIAARACADRIAFLLDEKPGQTVGLRTRLETLVSAQTRLEVVTEGILTRMIQSDPSLRGYGLIIFDEFHERNLSADLGLALAWNAMEVLRPDLKTLFMSATLPSEDIRNSFGDMPLITIPGRTFPVEVQYLPPKPRERLEDGIVRLADAVMNQVTEGDILIFLPGFKEISRVRERLADVLPESGWDIRVLHGSLPPQEQRAVLEPHGVGARRVILSTNVAETSLTIPGVRAVIDSGLERRVRFDPSTGMNHYETADISNASADQRKGRAGRLGPGFCFRYWKETAYRQPQSQPEILESDLAPLVLETVLWGAKDVSDLRWITLPPEAAVGRARELLIDLGLLEPDGRVTEAGKKSASLGLHPRLSRMVTEAAGLGLGRAAALTAALLSDRDISGLSGEPDFRVRLEAWNRWVSGKSGLPEGTGLRLQAEMERVLRKAEIPNDQKIKEVDPESAGTLLLLAYPDRAARRTRVEPDGVSARFLLYGGRGAIVRGNLFRSDYLAIAELDGGETNGRVMLAAPLDKTVVETGKAGLLSEKTVLEWDGWTPKAKTEVRLGRLVLKERPASLPDKSILIEELISIIQKKGLQSLPWNDVSRRFLYRCRFVERYGKVSGWPDFSGEILFKNIENWLIVNCLFSGGPVLTEEILLLALYQYLGWENRKKLDNLAPDVIMLPSGSNKRVDYESGEIPRLSARLQEFFGCDDTPMICGEPIVLELLSPANRPVQLTRDLDGFWDRTYPEVKKELMGRYPRHYWPEDPRVAIATARAKPRGK